MCKLEDNQKTKHPIFVNPDWVELRSRMISRKRDIIRNEPIENLTIKHRRNVPKFADESDKNISILFVSINDGKAA